MRGLVLSHHSMLIPIYLKRVSSIVHFMCSQAFSMTPGHLVLFFPLQRSEQYAFSGEGHSQECLSLLNLTINSSLFSEGQTRSFDTGTRPVTRPLAILIFHSSGTPGVLQMKYCRYMADSHSWGRMCTEHSFSPGENVKSLG